MRLSYFLKGSWNCGVLKERPPAPPSLRSFGAAGQQVVPTQTPGSLNLCRSLCRSLCRIGRFSTKRAIKTLTEDEDEDEDEHEGDGH